MRIRTPDLAEGAPFPRDDLPVARDEAEADHASGRLGLASRQRGLPYANLVAHAEVVRVFVVSVGRRRVARGPDQAVGRT